MKFDDVKKLQQKKYREEFGHFLVEGEHLVLELQKVAASDPRFAHCELYVTDAYADWPTPFTTHLVTERQMAQIADTKTPQGILAVAPIPPSREKSANECGRAIYLHEIQDPGNLGTILRTLAWFGGFTCLLSPGCVDPYNPKVVRASMGAIFHVPLETDVTVDTLRTRFERFACLDMHGAPVRSEDFRECDCYVFGNEARGVPPELIDALAAQPFTIAGAGAIESLNLGSAVTICAYELAR
jgi:TrmH family RNA methyltransferase